MLRLLHALAPLFPHELIPAHVDNVLNKCGLCDKHNPRDLPVSVYLER